MVEGARLEIVCAVNAVPRFESLALRHFKYRPVGQVVKTPPFHGGNTGSNPVRVTIITTVIISYCYFIKDGMLRSRRPVAMHALAHPVRRRISSAGRALALQARGRRFEPCILHHLIKYFISSRGGATSKTSTE